MWGNIPTPHGPCSYCNSHYHHVRNCPTAGQFSNYYYEHMNRPFSRPRNEYYCDSYNPAWSNQSNFSWQAQDHGRYAPQGHELHHQSYSQFNDQSYSSQYQATPQQQYQAAPPPRYDSNFEDRMLQMMGKIRDKLNVTVDKMTQTIKSCSESIVKIETYEEEPSPIYWLPQQYQAEPPPQKNFNVEESIAKIEAHLEKSINHPNREDGELQGQPVANPNEHYMVDESTYPEQAITTLRSEEVVKNHVEERKEEKKEEQIEASQDLLREKCKEVSTEASSPSILIPEAPYELRALIPSNLKILFLDIDDTLPVISSYDLPRGQENRLLGLLEEHKETTSVEKFPEYSPHFTPVHDSLPDEKLFENTQRDLPQYVKIQNYLSIGKIHSLWSKRRKDWCFKFKLTGSENTERIKDVDSVDLADSIYFD
jgi:hypothetical protein